SRMELERARRESRLPVLPYGSEPSEELWKVAGKVLRKGGEKRVAYDEASPSFLCKLRREAGEIRLLKFKGFFGEFCEPKTPREIGWMRKAAEIALKGLECASELVGEGRSEREIAAEVEYEMRKAGSEGTPFPTIVASGRNSLLPHATSTSKKLRRGELVVVDLGALYRGYSSDLTRTFALFPSRRQEKLVEAVKAAQLAALERVKAGEKAERVEEAAREELEAGGYGKHLLHGVGHGIGLEVHESPSLRRGSRDVLRKNSVITVEPGAYVPGVGGARWEDMAVVKEGGAALLSGGEGV
ncbi:MAG: M24 family metallopeptidase, partial [Candidatus Hadarchaeales archaeon]